MVEAPGERLQAWRDGLDKALLGAQTTTGRLDRATWGLQPHQIAQQQQFMRIVSRFS